MSNQVDNTTDNQADNSTTTSQNATENLESLVGTEEGLKQVLNNPKVQEEIQKLTQSALDAFKNETLVNYVDKSKLDELEKDYKAKLETMKIDNAIENSLAGNKYKDLLITKIDRAKIVVTDLGVVGLNEQIEGLKTSYSDLFTTTVNTQTPPAPKPNEVLDDKTKLNNRLEELKKMPKTNNVMAEILKINGQLAQMN